MIRLPKALAGQLVLLVLGTVVCAAVIANSILYFTLERYVDSYDEELIVRNVLAVRDRLETSVTEQWPQALEMMGTARASYWVTASPRADRSFDDESMIEMFAQHAPGTVVQIQEIELELAALWDHLWNPRNIERCVHAAAESVNSSSCALRVFSLRLKNGYWLNASTAHEPTMIFVLVPVSIVALITMSLLILAAIVLVRRIVRPLEELSESVERFGRGEVVEAHQIEGPRELASLAASFGLMQERLTRFIQDRTRMLGAISHDLRTPITSLRIRTEFIENDELKAEMNSVLEDMEKMVNSTLSFARIDELETMREQVDLVQMLKVLASEIPNVVFVSEETSCICQCHEIGIKRVFRNLLENANMYGGGATVSLHVNGTEICVVIQDEGPGIPEDMLEDVFEPFVRVDQARNVESGSVGLGLSIARTIIHKHGGRIELKNRRDGLEVSVVLPA